MMIEDIAYVAINHNGRKPYMMLWSVRPLAKQVRDAVLDNWPVRVDCGRPEWREIRRAGVSIRKIKVQTV